MENILIEWSDEFAICDVIDVQHKKMVEIINNLYDAFVNAKVKEIIKPIIDELFEYTVYHFTTEEKMFEEKNYTFTEAHKKEHQYFVDEIKKFNERFMKNDSLVAYDVMNFLKKWLLNHILKSDRKYIKEIC